MNRHLVMHHPMIVATLSVVLLGASAAGQAADTPAKSPNVLFIAMDDLNDWVGCLGGLREPKAAWPHAAVTQLPTPDMYSVSHEHWRYIHYTNGDEELYDIATDPHEWTNLLHDHATAELKTRAAQLRAMAPSHPAPLAEVPLAWLPALPWHPASEGDAPRSKPDGNPFDVTFINSREESVELFWLTPDGGTKSYGFIAPAKTQRQQTRPGAVWEIRSEKGTRLGSFVIGDRSAKAVIPDDAGTPSKSSTPKP